MPQNERMHRLRRFAPVLALLLTLQLARTTRADDAPPNLVPRHPDIPAALPGSGLTNPVDLILQSHFAQFESPPAEVVSDRVFARRAFLDLVGLLPAAEKLRQFLDDSRPDKRQLLVRELLDDREAYAAHWLSFWNDLLRNEYRGTGFIDDGRTQITEWLYQALYENKPYHQFVHQLISPVDGSQGFTKGIVWRGVVNASQRPEVQAAQNVSQVFLGTNLKCASCHDSFINDWKLADAYALASVFAEKPLEIFRCDLPTGETSEVRFLFPQVGAIDAAASREDRMRQLADLVTSERNGRLTRTIANRFWSLLMGRGLVEPLNEMENDPWNADLLDWLAADLVDHDYDLKQTLETICTSRAYQLPSVAMPAVADARFIFRGPLVRRMTAEQFADALAALTHVPPADPAGFLHKDGRGQGGQFGAVRAALARQPQRAGLQAVQSAKWLWNHADAATGVPTGRIWLRKRFHLDKKPAKVTAVASGDNEFKLLVNGRKVLSGSRWDEPELVDIAPHLVEGENVIAAEATNGPDPERDPKAAAAEPPSSAGFICLLVAGDIEQPDWSLASDATWLCSSVLGGGWDVLEFDTSGWQHAVEVAGADGGPWQLAGRLAASFGLAEQDVRASLAMSDPLTAALGRPNREQVVTRRDSLATMLQALELTNGRTLDGLLHEGAKRRAPRPDMSSATFVDRIFMEALGRPPAQNEQDVALGLLGSPATEDGIVDLIWVITMLPEFQLIY